MIDKDTKKVVCDYCGDEIQSTDYYVVALDGLELKSFHDKCYSSLLKSMQSMFLEKPINSIKMKASAFISFIFGVFLIFYSFFSESYFLYLGLLLFFPIIIVAYAWYKYERLLK